MVTKMVANRWPRAGIERHATVRATGFHYTNQHLLGQNETGRNGHQQISSAVLSTKPRTCKCLVGPVESQGAALAAAFNAGTALTHLPGRQRRAIARTARPCDKNDARRTGRSVSFRCGAQVIRTRAAVGGFWPPSRRASCPTSPKTSPAPEWCKAASVSRWFASHWRKSTATKARPRRPPVAKTRVTLVRSSPDPCARTRDEIESLVSSLARSAWTCPTALPPASRAGRAPKLLLERAGERHAAAGSLVH